MNVESIQTSGIEKFAQSLGVGLGKVSSKFVQDAILGIHKARSVNLTAIASVLQENIELHATHKRLSRNLGRPEINQIVSSRLLQKGARRVKKNTRLVVRVYEFHKKYACKMEYIGDSASYRVCEVVASDLGSRVYVPLLVKVWSTQVPGFVSDDVELELALRQVMEATSGRGILFFESNLKTETLDRLVQFQNSRFEVGVDLAETLLYRGKPMTVGDLSTDRDTEYGLTVFKMIDGVERSIFCHYGSIPVRWPGLPSRKLNLVVIKSRGFNGEDQVTPLLTTEPMKRNRQLLTDAVMSYSGCFDVTQLNATHRCEFEPERFRVLTFDRLQLLQTFLQAVIFYEAAIAKSRLMEDQVVEAKPRVGDHQRNFMVPQHMAAG